MPTSFRLILSVLFFLPTIAAARCLDASDDSASVDSGRARVLAVCGRAPTTRRRHYRRCASQVASALVRTGGLRPTCRRMVVGSSRSLGTMPTTTASALSATPAIFIIMMENHDWSSFKGSADAPYINTTLLPTYAHAENYRTGGIYPSLPNYIALEAGDDFGLLGMSPLPTDFRIATTDHLTTYLANAGIPWKSYSEMLPGGGTVCPLTESGVYSLDHNAYVYFDDVTGNPPRSDDVYCRDHIRPYEELATDLQNDAVAGYNFIIPDDLDQGEKHTSSGSSLVAQSDTWLETEVPKILASPAYQRDGVLLIVWDEAKTHGVDNPIGCILVSKLAKPGYSNTIAYSHASTLRTVQEILGVTPLIRQAATATDLSDLFTTFPGSTSPSTTTTVRASTTSTSTSTTSTSTSTTTTSTSTTSTSTSTTSTSINATSTSTSTSTTSTSTSTTSTSTPTSSTSTTSTSLPASSGGTATYQAGVGGPLGSAAVDTNIRLSTPSTSYGSDVNLYVGVTNAPDKVYRTLMAFDLAGIPAGATVTACTLTVNVTQRTSPTPGHLRRLCGEHWRDGDGQSEAQATWSAWQTGAAWTTAGAGSSAACTAGGDATADGEIAYAPPPGTGPFTFPDLTPFCQDAVAQRGGWLRLHISQDAESTQSNLFRFDSSDADTPTTRPKLAVTWAAPTTTSTSTSTTTSSSTSSSSTTSTSTTSTTSSTSTSTSSTTTSTSLPPPRTITYQAGVSGPTGSAAVDTNIRLSTPSTTYGTDASLYVGVTNGPDKVYRTLMAFDLAGIPAGATVTACTLTVNVAQRTNPTPGHIRRLCGEHWRDGDGQSEAEATWAAWQTGTAWTTAGADSSAACTAGGDATTVGELAYVPPGGTGPFTFPDLSALCQDAVAQRGGWLRLRITQDAESTQSNLFRFDSSDAAAPADRPQLAVTWTAP